MILQERAQLNQYQFPTKPSCPQQASLLQVVLIYATHLRPTPPLRNPACSSLPSLAKMATPASHKIISFQVFKKRGYIKFTHVSKHGNLWITGLGWLLFSFIFFYCFSISIIYIMFIKEKLSKRWKYFYLIKSFIYHQISFYNLILTG